MMAEKGFPRLRTGGATVGWNSSVIGVQEADFEPAEADFPAGQRGAA
jgi:hypothetical protein